jgi:hypothetical protein
MARFFLNIREGGELIYDTEGGRLSFYCGSDSGSGPIGAEIMANSILAGRNPGGGRFEIGDDSGQIVLIMPFEEAIGSA